MDFMAQLTRCLLPVALVVIAGCAQAPTESSPSPNAQPAPSSTPLDVNHDYHSYANTDAFRTEHVALDLAVDFDKRVLAGTVELSLQRLSATATDLVLDTRDLDIAHVEAAAGKGAYAPTTFKLDP